MPSTRGKKRARIEPAQDPDAVRDADIQFDLDVNHWSEVLGGGEALDQRVLQGCLAQAEPWRYLRSVIEAATLRQFGTRDARHPAVIQIGAGPARYALRRAVLLGRSKTLVDITLFDPTVSNVHAVLVPRNDGGVQVVDLGSTNHTTVLQAGHEVVELNRRALHVHGTPALFELHLGAVRCIIHP